MKKILLFFALVICFVSCNKQQSVKQETETEIRAKSDTTLSFKGIVLGEPIDSTLVDSICHSEVILVDGSVEYKMSSPSVLDYIKDVKNRKPGIVEEISMCTFNSQPLSIMPLVGLYEEAYGEFSYMRSDHGLAESSSYMVIGENSGSDNEPITRKDVVDTFLEMALFVKNNPQNKISFSFVWEWKEKSIEIIYYPGISNMGNTFVRYLHKGYTERMKRTEEENHRIDSIHNAQDARMSAIKKSQDI